MPLIGPIIGISCGLGEGDNFCLRRFYVQALAAAGAVGVILPPLALPAQAWAVCRRLDGLLLSGGGDFRPQLWGEYPHPGLPQPDIAREDWDLALLRGFWQAGKPILGICRGMQLLNVALGGSLWQDLGERPETLLHMQAGPPEQGSHMVRLRGGLANWLGTAELWVNSLHHQGVRRLGWGLRAGAVAADGLIEAVYAAGRSFTLGVQWHPERLTDIYSRRLWQEFVRACGA